MRGFDMPQLIQKQKSQESQFSLLKKNIQSKYQKYFEEIMNNQILEQAKPFFKQLKVIINSSIEKKIINCQIDESKHFEQTKSLYYIKNNRQLYESIIQLIFDQQHQQLQFNLSNFSGHFQYMKSIFSQEINEFKKQMNDDDIEEFNQYFIKNIQDLSKSIDSNFKNLQLSRVILQLFSFQEIGTLLNYGDNQIYTQIESNIKQIKDQNHIEKLIQNINTLEEQYKKYFEIQLNYIQLFLSELMLSFDKQVKSKQVLYQKQYNEIEGKFQTLSWNPIMQVNKKILVWISDNVQQKYPEQIYFESNLKSQKLVYLKSINDLKNLIEQETQQSKELDNNELIQSFHSKKLQNYRFNSDQMIQKQTQKLQRYNTFSFKNTQNDTQNIKPPIQQNRAQLNYENQFYNQEQLDSNMNSDQSLLQSMIWQKELCSALESNNKTPSIQVYLILSGQTINQSLNNITKEVNFVAIFSKYSNNQMNLIKNNNVQIISDDIIQIIHKVKETLKQSQIVYSCQHSDLYKYFKKRNPLEYLSFQTFCAQQVEGKSQEQLQEIIKQTCCSYPQNSEMDKFSQDKQNQLATYIQQQFKTINEVLTLYTKNRMFYQFINYILTRMNEEALENASYFIQTLRYALSAYDDKSLYMFKQPNFAVYRGIEVDVNSFKQQFPIGSNFITFNFSSSSLELETAKSFTQKSNFLFEITFNIIQEEIFKKCRPKYIQAISRYQDEKEVLFNCFSSFAVKGYKEIGNQVKFTVCQLEFLENPIL